MSILRVYSDPEWRLESFVRHIHLPSGWGRNMIENGKDTLNLTIFRTRVLRWLHECPFLKPGTLSQFGVEMKKKMRLSPLNHFQNGLATCDQILPNSFFFFLRGRRPFLAWDWTAFQISFTFFRESPRIKPCIPFKFDTPWLDSLLKCRVSHFLLNWSQSSLILPRPV